MHDSSVRWDGGLWVSWELFTLRAVTIIRENGPGLYIDGGLVVFKNKSGLKSEKIKKSIQSIFQENELK